MLSIFGLIHVRLTTKNNVNNKASKSQLSKGPPQGHDKLIKDPVQVHNRYGHLDDSEEEPVWKFQLN
jgi:hypothetical protein